MMYATAIAVIIAMIAANVAIVALHIRGRGRRIVKWSLVLVPVMVVVDMGYQYGRAPMHNFDHGMAAMQKQDYQTALSCFAKCDNSVIALKRKGECEYYLADYTAALNTANRIFTFPTPEAQREGHYLKGAILAKQGKIPEARHEFETARDLGHVNAGRALEQIQ